MKPQDIETESFRIIETEAGAHGFTQEKWEIVRRMIHTSADFDYLQTVRFSPDAVAAGIAALQGGADIITDTNMARSGIRLSALEGFGGSAFCFISDPIVVKTAAQTGETRAETAVDFAVARTAGGIYVIGNAPTALLRLIDRIKKNTAKPALVIGLPVGFVNAAESKAELTKTGVPFITNTGRKGGSPVAAAVVNALLRLAANRRAA
jgi:precorrin-8X/cobalt-precorrin-8 methylmutase